MIDAQHAIAVLIDDTERQARVIAEYRAHIDALLAERSELHALARAALWRVADPKRLTKHGAQLPDTAILLDDGSAIVGEAQNADEAAALVNTHNKTVLAVLREILATFSDKTGSP